MQGMKKQVTFLHTADLHLGVSFKGLRALSESWAKRLLSAVTESYNRVIDAAIDQEVDFVVIAGDIFDGTQTSYADYLGFVKGLERLNDKNIPVYLCTGNHDPLASWQKDYSQLPANTHLFAADQPSFKVFTRDGQSLAILGGRSYYTKSWPADEDISHGITREAARDATQVDAPFAIGVIHSGLNIDLQYSPVEPAKLLSTGMDYWALGHIHERLTLPADDPTIVFPGCVQGRDINETGEKGFYKVTLTEGQDNQVTFIPTASVVWQKIELDVRTCTSIVDIGERIARELVAATNKSNCEEICARITLTGRTNLSKTLKSPGVLEDLRKSINDTYPLFFCDAIVDKTTLPLDKNALVKEGLFPAVFMQGADSFKRDRDKSIAAVQDEFLSKNIPLTLINDKDIDRLASEAEDMVLDLLGQGES